MLTRLTDIVIVVVLALVATACGSADSGGQVMVAGRVAAFESVVAYCDGDTAVAQSISRPLPVGSSYLTAERMGVEHAWNTLHMRWAPTVAIVLVIVLCMFLPYRIARVIRWIPLLLLASDMAMRWVMTGAVPLITGADTLRAIAMFAAACVPFIPRADRRMAVLLLCAVALLAGAAALMEGHPAVNPVNPTLLSSWLPVHVGLMMAAYSLMLCAAVAAIAGSVGKLTFRTIVAGEALLAAGIIVGALWAAEAWGRYWAWDPKETWALVTSLVYAAVLASWGATAKRPLLRRAVVALAFLAVVFTWWGVNRLGGLHAY